ncbi:hypothetical protein HRbin01_01900 [archaeon HR01]|nr:hypothetical protein HRbin01_01900 [archaeon HR01]
MHNGRGASKAIDPPRKGKLTVSVAGRKKCFILDKGPCS